jgi:NitT/TauT family transport system substrate-binding protein
VSELRRMIKEKISGILAVLICCLMITACSEQKATPIRLGTNVWLGYEPLYLARELAYFDEKTVKLVDFLSASEAIRAFKNKSIDAAALTLDEAMLLLEHNIPVKIILVHDISDGGDVIMGSPEIRSFEDIVGKRVGVEGSALGAYTLSRALELYGLALENVQLVQLEANEYEKAYQEGHIDAAVTFEPVRTKLLVAGAHELFTSREIPGEIVDVLVVHQDRLEVNQDHIKSLTNGWFRALEYLQKNPDDAAKHMSGRLKITPEQVIQGYAGIKLPSREENIHLLTGESPGLLASAERLQKVMIDNKLLKASLPVPVRDLFVETIPGLNDQ